MLTNTASSYGTVARLFHWLSAILIIGMIVLGFYMHDVRDPVLRSKLYMIHKSFGSISLAILVCRLSWRLLNVQPKLEGIISKFQQVLGRLVHRIFYLLLFVMPISGLSMTFFSGRKLNIFNIYTINPGFQKNWNIVRLAHDYHEGVAITIISLIILHTSAAFLHQFVQKTNVLYRMWPLWPIRKNNRDL